MSYKIVIVDEAKLDFREALNYYKDINPKLSRRFTQSFMESLKAVRIILNYFKLDLMMLELKS